MIEKTKVKEIHLGKSDFKALRKIISKEPSPKTKSNEQLQARIDFCEKELKIHKDTENHRMFGYKLAEIDDLKKKLR